MGAHAPPLILILPSFFFQENPLEIGFRVWNFIFPEFEILILRENVRNIRFKLFLVEIVGTSFNYTETELDEN